MTDVISGPNRNLLWARVFVDELARGGLRDVVIAPGSRSTPLVFAFAERDDMTVYSLLDERGAAFFALGLAQAADRPVAILCTSGTAAANFLPAVVEAHYGRIPLLVLTADRSHELRESGANQTVDQVRLYGTHALWSVDVALPEAHPPAVLLRSLRTLAARALRKADGTPKGAVQLNFPFRKPLEPTIEAGVLEHTPVGPADGEPSTRVLDAMPEPSAAQIARLADVLSAAHRLAIVCGPRSPGGDFPAAVQALAQQTGAVLFADALSGVRFGVGTLAGYDTYLTTAGRPEAPDAVFLFGAPPTSQALSDYLALADGPRVLVTADDVWQDPDHLASDWLRADPARLCRAVIAVMEKRPRSVWVEAHERAAQAAQQAFSDVRRKQFFDGGIVAASIERLSADAQVFAASSLTVRNLDQFATSARPLRVIGNRGASGIDGTVSSAFGLAASNPAAPTLLLTGDLALYHDLNGLIAAGRLGLKLIIVAVNNNGGGIFHRLPVANFDPPFEALFVTPHGLTFEHAAAQFGLHYARPADEAGLQQAVDRALVDGESWLIEVMTDAKADLAARRQVIARTGELLAAEKSG
ncbi:MAG TPA: 2-succinyl-5-enolpyruvyl-6-hydroxy-3-cyclohexene-1-carboxylic-acid synthase [Candidatus Limnocylindrales bacterium]|nr:2-succinyl-5-enolpyruvyl-6-hydroxy-3-cyclohexene-1-carboxylic-acid synthase [Candidatus Limnocylindrales bacterium]